MPGLSKFLKTTSAAAAATAAAFGIYTKDSHFVDADITTSAIVASGIYSKYNPHNSPPLHDVCRRVVPVEQLRPELRNDNKELVRAFCAGVFGGPGYDIQRRILAHKYQSVPTITHLWSQSSLKASQYRVGTCITDHFEVIENAADEKEGRIIVRCGDSPRKQEIPRAGDGTFEMIVRKEGTDAVFELRSTFWDGTQKGKSGEEGEKERKEKPHGPMPAWMAGLHRAYAKVWMETSVRSLMQ